MFFALFVAVVVGLIVEPFPAAFVGLLGVVVAMILRVGPAVKSGASASPADIIRWGLSGFSNTTVWLIFAAFMFALGYKKTGLGQRISLILIQYLGKTTLGLGYAIAFADLILSPFMPSNTARSGGTLYPVISNIPGMFDCSPEKNPRKIGAYLTWVALATTCVTSSMFYTALAPNALAVSTLGSSFVFTWGEWFIGFAPVGIVLFLATPLLTYCIYPPSIKSSPDAPEWARQELKKIGPITKKELLMFFFAFLALILWIFEKQLSIHATTTAITILTLMIVTNILSWDDILQNKGAWSVFIWFGTLIPLATGLKNVGFLQWFANTIQNAVVTLSPITAIILLIACFFLLHYFFASVSAHVSALLLLFVSIGGQIAGLPVHAFTMMLLYTLGIMGILTPYACGPSPIWYGSGYISAKAFWLLGGIFGLLYLVALLGIGIPWMYYIYSV